jgi:hypothetical protein
MSEAPCNDLPPRPPFQSQARGLGAPLEPSALDAAGVWRFELEKVRQGVVDLVWDVASATDSLRQGYAQEAAA